jgi:carboxyl-terminal processing protease
MLGVLAVLAVMTTSFLAGVTVGRDDSKQNGVASAAGTTAPSQPLADLWQAYQRLNSDSYYRPLDQKQLDYGAAAGLLAGCCPGDTHTTFSPPQANAPLAKALNEETFGIGATVAMTQHGLEVTQPLPGSAAAAAGLRAGDVITAVGGTDLRRLTLVQAVALVDGPNGTVVRLTVVRRGGTKPLVVRVMRRTVPTVVPQLFGTIGYLRFTIFGADTAAEFHRSLAWLLSRHVKGVLIDVRGNGGGYVDAATAIASEFLPRGAVIFWERANLGGHFGDTPTIVTAPGIAQHLPVVVLVDHDTASAAEILTSALREHGRARVVGTTTFGKGSEQELVTLADGSALRITTHLWLTPRKHTIEKVGIRPDVVVSASPGSQDRQLAAALRLLPT